MVEIMGHQPDNRISCGPVGDPPAISIHRHLGISHSEYKRARSLITLEYIFDFFFRVVVDSWFVLGLVVNFMNRLVAGGGYTHPGIGRYAGVPNAIKR